MEPPHSSNALTLNMPKRDSRGDEASTRGGHTQQLREAPTFHPTAAEFEDPLRYIMSIREESEQFGICW